MTPSSPPDCDAYLLLKSSDLAKMAGVYGGHDAGIKRAGQAQAISAWMMVQDGVLGETVGVSFWFNSPNTRLSIGEY